MSLNKNACCEAIKYSTQVSQIIMCIGERYLACCGHYTPIAYDFCDKAWEKAKANATHLRMCLFMGEPEKIRPEWERVYPCEKVKEKHNDKSPYWKRHLCEDCEKASRDRSIRR